MNILTSAIAQSLFHAALCCQKKDHSSGYVRDNGKSLSDRISCYANLRKACSELNPSIDGQHQNLYEFFVDSNQAEEIDVVDSLTLAGAFVERMLLQWGLEHGIDPYTGESRVWFDPSELYYECQPGKRVHATSAQVETMNKLCNRYKGKPTKWWLEVTRTASDMSPDTLFAVWESPNITIGIEPDGYAHS